MSYTYTDSDEKSSKNADRIFTDSSIMQFGERLKEAIGNESVMSFAKKCGMSDSLIGRYIRGQSYPGIDKLPAIASASGKPLEWFLTGTTDDAPQKKNEIEVSDKELQEWWDIIARSMSRDELLRAVEAFKNGGKTALFASILTNSTESVSERDSAGQRTSSAFSKSNPLTHKKTG
ncbi:helix-turn-helix transcriptional regulator [Erwinia sp. HR93]|uniref:helix-turn-helix domain-containing protein n=1 Tax=Erwinia sp. HR93 TaxID=3094840 RepID=UPI002ADEE69F|nr:helix-turn-helix transcriptional regulator [Erwinia sp. HR93]MEA1062286.1 helix-turn-helix transcriptional regulator [Erwinia sp. HR93]